MTSGNRVQQFEAAIGKGIDASFEEFRREVRNAYMDRTRQVYFIWKKLKEIYPEVDADRVVREASWDFGVYQGRKIAAKAGRDDLGPAEVLLGQTSKGGMAVFDQVTPLSSEVNSFTTVCAALVAAVTRVLI